MSVVDELSEDGAVVKVFSETELELKVELLVIATGREEGIVTCELAHCVVLVLIILEVVLEVVLAMSKEVVLDELERETVRISDCEEDSVVDSTDEGDSVADGNADEEE